MFDPNSQHFYTFNTPPTHTNGNYNDLAHQILKIKIEKPALDQVRDDESGVYSPPLWKSSTPSNNGNLSPNSRSRAIAKGQRELMEIARNMPECFYELSLRDIVESPICESPKLDDDDDERCLFDHEKNFERKTSLKQIPKRQGSIKGGKRIERVKSAKVENGGMFLKMGFSVKKKSLGMSSSSSSKRVSPKVEILRKSFSENDWRNKKISGSSGSENTESGVMSSSSGSNKSTRSNINNSRNNRKSKGCSAGCWSFALSRKNKRKTN